MKIIKNIRDIKRSEKILDRLSKEDPESIREAYEDLYKNNSDEDAVFSVDGQYEKIPFQKLRSYLKENNPSFKDNRIVKRESELVTPSKDFNYENDSMQEDSEDEYYWDDPSRGYEHMNPASYEDQVLKKKKKY